MNDFIYEVVSNDLTTIIKRTNIDESISWIMADEANADYQQYLVDTDGGLLIPKPVK
jgi:hypothetical protein